MKRFKGGPLVKEMVQHITDKIAGKLDPRLKFFMYSAHDTTVATFLNTLSLYEMIPPPYASAVLVELLKKKSSEQNFVRISFKNSTGEPVILTVPGCESLCPIEDFVRITKPIVPDNWNEECQTTDFIQYLGGSFFGRLTENDRCLITTCSFILFTIKRT